MTLIKNTIPKTNYYTWDSLMNAINTSAIIVEVVNGVVTLRGEVDVYAKKVAAVEAAACISGVKEIVCEIKVSAPEKQVKSDDDIEQQVVKLLTARHYSAKAETSKTEFAYWEVFE